MFTKSVLYSSLLALALGKPIARRDHPEGTPLNIVPFVVRDGSPFDSTSTTIQQFPSTLSFDGFGGLQSLAGFDSFYGANNYCGVRNVLVVEQVVTCTVTPVTVIQQHLAVVAEYVKKVVLTQSCETEAQVIVFNQWLGNLVGFGQDLRRTTSRTPTYDSVIAAQLPQLVDVTGNINTAGFSWTGSSIGSHAVTIAGGNWNQQVSPASVELTWQSCLAAAGPEIPLGVHCSSTVCTAPVVVVPQHVPAPVITETIVHTPVVVEHTPVITTVVEHTPVVVEHTPVVTTVVQQVPVVTTVIQHVPVVSTVVEHVPVVTTVVEHSAVTVTETVVHTVVAEHTPVTTVIQEHTPVHTTVVEHTPVHTIQTHPAPVPTVIHETIPPVHSTSTTVVEHPVETVISKGEVSTETTATEAPLETAPVESTGDVEVNGGDIDIQIPPAETTEEVPVATTTESSETATVSDSESVSETAAPETTTDAAADSTSADAATTTDAAAASETTAVSPFTVPTDSEAIPVARVRRLPPGVARRAWSSRRRV